VRVDRYAKEQNRNLSLGKRDCAMLGDVIAKLSERDVLSPEEQEFTRQLIARAYRVAFPEQLTDDIRKEPTP